MDWKQIVAGVAPALGTALGGPLAGQAVSILAQALGMRPDVPEGAVESAVLGMTPDQRLALQKADQDFKLEMARIAQAQDAAALADTQNARGQTVALAQAGSTIAWGAVGVSLLIVVGYFFCIYRLFIVPADLPPNAFQLLNVMFGALSIAFGQVCNYWLGSSAGSKASGDAVRKIAEKAAAQ